MIQVVGLVENPPDGLRDFLADRFKKFLKECGFTPNEILAVFRPSVSATDVLGWPLPDVLARLEAIRGVRQREDFAHLVDLTKRVDNFLTKSIRP